MIWLVLIVTSVYAVLGQDIVPLIIKDAEDYTGYTAHFKGLRVRVNTVAGSKFHWRHNGHKIDENYKPAFYDPYATKLDVADNPAIEYAGIYQFYMETPVGTITGRNATVEFTYLGDFVNPSSSEDIRKVVVGQAAFIKCPAHTSGHNFIYKWGKTAIVGGVNFIKSAPNYIVLNDGTLFFSHLKKEDVKYFNIQEARCGMEANAEELNRFKWAHLPTQFRNVSENFTQFGPEIVTSLPNRMYVLDETIAMVCAATGNPVPIYTWKKIDSEGNEKDIVHNQDGYMFENKDTRILVIEKAQVSHSGRYRCTATIGQKSDTNEGELKYHIKPEWVLPKIASVKVSIYSSHSWQCNATSHPLPRYKWYVNGTELADSPQHRIVGGNITFPRLEKKQSGMYECFAFNKLDNIHQIAHLDVEAVKPTFVSNTGKTTLFVNNPGKIECHAYAAPDAKNTWEKDGVRIDTGLSNYELINNEHLVIKTVKKDDSGEYTCTARNMFGTDVKKIQVQVVGEIKFFKKPQNRNITRGERFDLTCEARGEDNLGTPIKYKWTFKGKDLPLNGTIVWSENIFKLLFIDPQVSQSGDYECIAYIEQPSYAEIKQTARVIVRGPPEAPNTVVVESGCAGLSAKLSWNIPSNSYDPIKYFIIQLSTSYRPDDWRNDTKVLPPLSEKVVENLSPFTQYRFRVLAKNKLGTSEPSKYTRFGECKTPERAPTICPTVHGKPGKAEELTIKWKKMELIDQNGADFKYHLQYRKLGENDWKIHSAGSVSTEFHISKAGYYQLWEFQIQGVNKVGGGPFCEGKAFSGQKAPLVAPEGFRALQFGSDYAVLGWTPIELKRGGVDGYKLSYWQEGVSRSRRSINAQHCDKKKPCKIDIPGSRTNEKRLDGLLSYKTYTMTLSGYNSGGMGPSTTLKVDTTEGRPGAPEAVVATPYAKYIKLEWREPSALNGVITGYNVSIAVGSTILKKKELGGGATKHVFGGLEPNKNYILSAQAKTKEGFGPSKSIQTKTKLPAVPAKPAVPLVQGTGKDMVNITFKEGVPVKGFPEQFYVVYRLTGQKDLKKTEPQSLFGDSSQPFIVVPDLDKSREYEFATVASNAFGKSERSDFNKTFPGKKEPTAKARTSPIYKRSWFVAVVVVVCVLLLILLIALLITRKRGERYPVGKREKRRAGILDDAEEPESDAYPMKPPRHAGNGLNRNNSRDSLPNKDADRDSLDDYGEDKFGEDAASLIGEYNDDKKPTSVGPEFV